MKVVDAIRTRRSTRRFSYEPIAKDVLVQLIDCGRWAPSGRNEQPIEYVVVDDTKVIHEIAGLTDNGRFASDAGALILVVAADTKYYLEDGSAAVQNILLAATANGLASCWIAGDKKYYSAQICARMGVPEGHKLVAILAVGASAEDEAKPRERRPIGDVLHWNRYRNH